LANWEIIAANREFRLCGLGENSRIYLSTGKKLGTGGAARRAFSCRNTWTHEQWPCRQVYAQPEHGCCGVIAPDYQTRRTLIERTFYVSRQVFEWFLRCVIRKTDKSFDIEIFIEAAFEHHQATIAFVKDLHNIVSALVRVAAKANNIYCWCLACAANSKYFIQVTPIVLSGR
jgi:hypothetical protein